jgi:tRNA(Met) cytidine acetyltransferase
MIPDVLTSQLRDESAGISEGMRVLRIATHNEARSRGLGTALLEGIREEFASEVDWLGTGYGVTPELVRFWNRCGFRTVHLSTRRNETSGEHSVVMLDPTSEAGRRLHDRHAEWFLDRIEGMLTDPLDDVDPDVVTSALGSVEATPNLDLSDWEWRFLAGLPHGASIVDTSPRPLRRVVLRYLVDGGVAAVNNEAATASAGAPDERTMDTETELTVRQRRLLIRKVLQAQSWGTVTEALDFPGHSACMRALGTAVGPLLSRYGNETVASERERFE